MTSFTPDPRLRPLVRRYTDFAQRADGPVVMSETPIAGLVVIVDLEAGWTVQGERFGSFAAGLTDGPTTVRHEGVSRAFQLDLSPLAARSLLGVPAGELGGLTVGLQDVLGAEAGRLADALHAAPDARARASLIDAALLRRMVRAAPADEVAPDIARAWSLLERSGGQVRIEALAQELRCSRRHLARRFAAEVGLAPKAAARVLRFERAQALMMDAMPLSGVAIGAGYADQAHLSREVKSLSGRSPAALAAERLAWASVPDVQDGPLVPA
jgi:AraC-like DNA-binding protein